MNKTSLTVALKAVGVLSGLMATGMLCVGLVLLISAAQAAEWGMMTLSLFPLMLAGYFAYVAYLVWFRFSPLAVQHVCGLLGFCVIMLLDPRHDSFSPWRSFAFLACLIAVYFGYKAVSRWLSRQLFPEPSPDVQT